MNRILVLGASGATGRLLVECLLEKNAMVTALVRNAGSLKVKDKAHSNLKIIEGSISDMWIDDLTPLIVEADVVCSCLGHILSFKGIFGHPRRLVTDTIRKAVEVMESTKTKRFKIILMNTTGNSNREIPEKPPLSQRVVISLLRLCLPPHVDNEEAADFLCQHVWKEYGNIEWTAVRPDTLIDESEVSPYDIVPSPTRNVIFNAGKTSRINVADFMSELALNEDLWNEWKGRMPVIYNQ